jgi:3-phenylpropionate/trans-cinnamate dioxygenase ferredoxin reductase subunit
MSLPIVIVGAGQAGIKAAESLRSLGVTDRIVMVGDEPHLPYQRPPLSKKYLLGKVADAQLWLQSPDFYKRKEIGLLAGVRVERIHVPARQVRLSDGQTLDYSKLIFATGSSPRRIPLPGADLDGVYVLRSIADVLKLREALGEIARVAIVGGGYIGLEVAAVLSELGKQVTVLEAQDRLLKRVTGETVASFLQELHRSRGVDIRLSAAVSEIEGEHHVERVCLAGGATLPADMVLMACGGVANDDVARTAGLACDGGVVVDAYGRTSAPDVYAAGDCARFPSPRYARTIRLESVQNAIDQARCVAQAIAGKLTVYDPLPWFWSDQFDTKLQIAGLSDEHTRSVVRGLPSTGSFSVEYYKGDALIAVDAINDAKAFMTARRTLSV